MRRALIACVVVVVVLLVSAGAAYVIRERINQPRPAQNAGADHAAMGMTAGTPQPTPDQSGPTPRGDVTIDPRRQQLIGVRTAPAMREPMQHGLRTVGTVRYNETTLADI